MAGKSGSARAAGPRRSSGSTPRGGRRRASGSRPCSTRTRPCLELGLWAAYRDVRGVGRCAGGGRRHGDRLGRRPARDGRRQRRHRQGRRLLPDDDQEDPAGPGDRRRRTGCRSSTSSIPSGVFLPHAGRGLPRRGRLRPDLPQQRRPLARRASRSSPRSWATASPAAPTCRSSATRC